MQTKCSADLFGFAPVEGRAVVAAFDGGRMTSEAGAMLLGTTDGQLRLIERFAGCFVDHRAADLVEHTVPGLVGQRVFGIALGYEDLIDHDQLRHDPVMAVLGGKLEARRSDCAALAGKSTLNRLELSQTEPSRYHKISYDGTLIEALFVDLFLDAHSGPPPQITLDLDATDDPLHGHQEERFFHGYGACPRAGEAGPGGQLLLQRKAPDPAVHRDAGDPQLLGDALLGQTLRTQHDDLSAPAITHRYRRRTSPPAQLLSFFRS